MKMPQLEELTLREKIGQTAMVQAPHLMALENAAEFLKDNPIGNVWHTCNHSMVATNLTEAPIGRPMPSEYYRKWAMEYTGMLKIPPLIGLDGPKSNAGTDIPPVIEDPVLGAANSDELAYLSGKYRALAARALGANWIWSPMVDIPSRFKAVGIMRACSDQLEKLQRISLQVVRGMQDHGVAATVKHFPGNDQVEYRDSHFAPTYNHSTLQQWRDLQKKSFTHLLDNGVYSIMISHGAFPASDDRKINGRTYIPSTISKNTVTGLLRDEIGYDGVAITDSIDMAALKVAYPNSEDLYVELLNAGNDVILNVPDLNYIDLVEKAVKEGRVSEERINEACRRVLEMKKKMGLFEAYEEVAITPEFTAEVVAFNQKVCQKAITLECDEDNRLPLDAAKIKNVAIVCSTHTESIFDALDAMKAAFEKRGMQVTKIRRILSDAEMERIDKENDLIIYASYIMPHAPMGASSFVGDECATFFYAFTKGLDKSIGVSLGSVYVYYDFYENMKMFAHAFSATPQSQEAFVDAIFGDIPFAGEMPYEPGGPRIN